VAIMFLGGWYLPFIDVSVQQDWIPELVMLLKVLLVFFVFTWVRAAHCRVRTDQILRFGWKVLLPLAVINLMVVIFIVMYGGTPWS